MVSRRVQRILVGTVGNSGCCGGCEVILKIMKRLETGFSPVPSLFIRDWIVLDV
jgi:hypothetical protein